MVRVALLAICLSSPVMADQIAVPGGFRLGSSLEEAMQHAASRDWQLVQLSEELPGNWVVADPDIGLFVCDDIVTSVTQRTSGDLDDFAQMVFGMTGTHGKPDIQVISLKAGGVTVSNVDAEFPERAGIVVKVQLSSTDDQLALSTNHILAGQCKDE
jgi:hypothetical protein